MSSFSPQPRPHVSSSPHLLDVETFREASFAVPELLWVTRQARDLPEEPKPSALHPRHDRVPLLDCTVERFVFQGRPRGQELSPPARQAWEARVGLSFAETITRLAEALAWNLVGGEVLMQRVDDVLESAQLTLRLLCPHGRRVASVEQELEFGEEEGVATYIPVSPAMGALAERALLAASLSLYDQAGIQSLRVLAEGGLAYTWAKCGFLPETEEDAWELFSELERRLGELPLRHRTRQLVGSLLARHRPEAVWAVSDLERVKVQTPHGRCSLGRTLLRETVWPAVLNLEDPVARERLARNLRSSLNET